MRSSRPASKRGRGAQHSVLKGAVLSARSIRDLEQGNRQLHSFLKDIADARPHPRKARQSVGDVFAEEQGKLLALPNDLPPVEVIAPAVGEAKAFVQLDTNRYSVPSVYAQTTLSMATTDTTVRIIDGLDEVANHQRSWGFKQTFERAEHRAQLLAERRGARELKGRDRLVVEVPRFATLLERWLDREFNLGSMVARTMKLLDSYGPRVLGLATDDMIARDLVDLGALAVLCERYRKRDGEGPPPIIDLAPYVDERDVVPHDLGGYDE